MVIYRQRTTIADDFLLHVVFPWLTVLRLTPLMRLAHFWSVPVAGAQSVVIAPNTVGKAWGKMGG